MPDPSSGRANISWINASSDAGDRHRVMAGLFAAVVLTLQTAVAAMAAPPALAAQPSERGAQTQAPAPNKANPAVLALPPGLTLRRSEWVSLPENRGGVPGPTDYLALVATIEASASARQSVLQALPDFGATLHVPPPFARPWLTPVQREALTDDQARDRYPGKDAQSLLARPAKRAILIDTPGPLLLYVEYLSLH